MLPLLVNHNFDFNYDFNFNLNYIYNYKYIYCAQMIPLLILMFFIIRRGLAMRRCGGAYIPNTSITAANIPSREHEMQIIQTQIEQSTETFVMHKCDTEVKRAHFRSVLAKIMPTAEEWYAARDNIKTKRQTFFSDALRRQMLERDPVCRGGCGTSFEFGIEQFDIDHRVPHSIGGPNDISNFQLLCLNCHRIKCNFEKSSKAYSGAFMGTRSGVNRFPTQRLDGL